MRAIVFDRHGGPEVLELRDVPEPALRPDEVRVEVKACGINHLDLWVRRGLPGLAVEMPHILGSDVAGVAAEVGAAVRHVKPGDRLLVLPTLSCGVCPACLAGDDNLCRHHDVLGRRRNGGYAEQVAVPGVNCLPCPEELTWEQAAAVPLVFLTAWHMLVGRARVRPGEDVLVIGASGGVGSAAVQVAKLHGARVIATAGERRSEPSARGNSAPTRCIDHSSRGRRRARPGAHREEGRRGRGRARRRPRVRAGGRRARARRAARHLRRHHRSRRSTLDLNLLFGRHLSLLGSWMGRRGELVEVLKHVRAGRLRPVVDTVLPLAEARRAHERIEARQMFGKVVLVP